MCDDEDGEQRFRDEEEGGESGRRHISEGGRVSVRFSLNDGAGKGDDGVSGGGGDYSCMSSCSLPSSPPSPSSPVLPSPQAGRLLKEALHRYFSSPPDSPDRGGGELCLQVRELFHQLAPRPAANFVSREDFEALCSVLGLTPTPPTSPPSGLQWLTTYCTRPGTPSPLREDRLSEAENPGSPQPSGPSASSFLWTLGPRPFWEGWAGKRGKRKELSLADFTRRLLEQWAVTHNLPLTLIHDADFVFNSPTPHKAKGQRQGLVDRLRRSKSREVEVETIGKDKVAIFRRKGDFPIIGVSERDISPIRENFDIKKVKYQIHIKLLKSRNPGDWKGESRREQQKPWKIRVNNEPSVEKSR